jgi:hypothetical protein
MKRSLFCIACTLPLWLSACAPGFIYTDITSPLGRNMHGTKITDKSGTSGGFQVNVPLDRANLSGSWAGLAVADAAKNGGITKVSYGDERLISILGGLFSRRTVTVYGE